MPDRVEGYSALCHAKLEARGRVRRARLGVNFLSPDRIRLEVLDPAGNSRALLVAAPAGALLLDPIHRRFETYPNGAEAVATLMGLAAPPDLLAMLLLGPERAASSSACAAGSGRAEDSLLHCRLVGGGELAFTEGAPDRADLRTAEGSPRLLLRWERRAAHPRSLPQSLEVRQDDSGTVLRLEPIQVQFSSPSADLFDLEPPSGFVPGIAETDW